MTARSTLRRIVVWGPLAAYLALIFYLSSRPSAGWAAHYPDKLLHFLEYGGLAFLTARAFNGGIRRPIPASRLVLSGMVVMIYALSDEIHQSFVPERTSDWRDVVADLCGAAVALIVIAIAGRYLRPLVAGGANRDVSSAAPLNNLAPKEPT